MKIDGSSKPKTKSVVSLEFFVGLVAVVLGGYNLAAKMGYITQFVEIPQIVGNVILVLAGLFLWVTAYRLSRYKYHTSRLF